MSEADLAGQLDKLRRRQKRNERAAWARGFLDGICALLKPGELVIDLGANVGDVAAPLAATGATVECFEPDPYAFSELTRRLGDAPNVTLFNAAAGIGAGTVTLRRAPGFEDRPRGASVKSTILEGGRGVSTDADDTLDVELIDFPAYLRAKIADHGEIALLKMDIEGAELDILETMEREGLFEGVGCTLAETHERKFKALRPRFRALKARISASYPPSRVNLDWI